MCPPHRSLTTWTRAIAGGLTTRLSLRLSSLVSDQGKFAGALNEVWEANCTDWEFGLDMNVPRGMRQAKSGVRNAHLRVATEHLVFKELQSQILHDLGAVYRVIEQSKRNIQLAHLRLDAARDTYQARLAAHQADAVTFDIMLDAQQKFLQAGLDLHNAISEGTATHGKVRTCICHSLGEAISHVPKSTAEDRASLLDRSLDRVEARLGSAKSTLRAWAGSLSQCNQRLVGDMQG